MERERQKAEGLRDKAMLSEMAAINNSVYGTGLSAVAVADDLPPRAQQASAPGAPKKAGPPAAPPLPASLLKLLRPGRIYYGEVDTEVNSDVPGPVLATIQTGKLKGARLLGGFTKAGDYVVLKFSSMTLPDSDVYPITAYALNPHKLQAGMATDVNHHYIERYGSMLLGAFLYGFGQAEMYSGGTGTVTQFGAPVFIPQMNSVLSQSALGLGMAGQQLASVTQQNFNIPATVHLHQNDPVAILIIRASAPKTVSAPAAPAPPARTAAPLPPVGPFGGTSPYGGGYGGSPYGGYPGGGLPMMPMMP
jgi:type IV secretory pathway VirB10-like protein